jgi:hypothetical protein
MRNKNIETKENLKKQIKLNILTKSFGYSICIKIIKYL